VVKDPFASLSSASISIAVMVGICGRNFGLDRLVTIQMICVIARKRGAVARDFVGDPSASGHFSRGNGTRDFA